MSEIAPIFFLLLTFGAVVGAVFGIGRYVNIKVQMQRRLPASGTLGAILRHSSRARACTLSSRKISMNGASVLTIRCAESCASTCCAPDFSATTL